MTNIDIVKHINTIKLQGRCNGSYKTNSFHNFALEKSEREHDVLMSEDSLCVIIHEPSVDRLLFFTVNDLDLVEISNLLGEGYVLDIVSKDSNLYADLLTKMGFKQLTKLQRVANKDMMLSILASTREMVLDFDKSIVAQVQHIEDIYNLLWNTFDTRISHLPDKEELERQIKSMEIRIIEDESGKIVTLYQVSVEPKSYYINQIINKGSKDSFHKMLIDDFKRYCDNGGRYVYAWVETENKASLGLFKKYGIVPDGLYTCVYVK